MHQEDTNSGSTNQKSPDGTGPQSLLHNGRLSLLLKVLAATVHPSGAPRGPLVGKGMESFLSFISL